MKLYITALFTLLFFAIPAIAEINISDDIETPPEPLAQCARLVHGCFGENEGESRSNCLFSTSKHAFCQGTKLGKLIYRRWIMSPIRIGGVDEQVPGFLGPKLVDQDCLNNFDNFFVSSLVNGQELEVQLDSLSETLSACTSEISPEFSRP